MNSESIFSKISKNQIFGSLTQILTKNILNDYPKATVLVLFNYSLKTLFLLFYIIKEKIKRKYFIHSMVYEDIHNRTTYEYDLDYVNDETFSETYYRIQSDIYNELKNTFKKIIFILMFLNFLSTYLFLYSISNSSEGNQFIIISLCPLFILLEKLVFFKGKL